MKETELDKNVLYTLKVELANGKVLLYYIDIENKQRLMDRLMENSESADGGDPLQFLWFETSLARQVIINTSDISRVTFVFDHIAAITSLAAYKGYNDNFSPASEETSTEEETEEKKTIFEEAMDEELDLPNAIVYFRGKDPEDHYEFNPFRYCSLSAGCLASFVMELEGEFPLRQFINLIDDDGEESFIPLAQIIVMEFDKNLLELEEEE